MFGLDTLSLPVFYPRRWIKVQDLSTVKMEPVGSSEKPVSTNKTTVLQTENTTP